MRIILALLASTFLIGCGKNGTTDGNLSEATPMAPIATVQMTSIPSACTFTGTANHTFRNWQTDAADLYACSAFSGMNCELAVSADHSEMTCSLISTLNPVGVISQCSSLTGGSSVFSHYFATTAYFSTADAYYCGVTYAALKCYYFRHDADGTDPTLREEILCNDILIVP